MNVWLLWKCHGPYIEDDLVGVYDQRSVMLREKHKIAGLNAAPVFLYYLEITLNESFSDQARMDTKEDQRP